MDNQRFDRLVKGVREMKRHMAGKSVRGARTTEPASALLKIVASNPRAIEALHGKASRFR